MYLYTSCMSYIGQVLYAHISSNKYTNIRHGYPYLYIMIYAYGSFRFYLPNFAINIVFTSRVRHSYLFWGIKHIGTAIIRFRWLLYIYIMYTYYFHLFIFRLVCRGSGKAPAGLSTEPRAGAEHRSQLLSDHLPGTNQTSWQNGHLYPRGRVTEGKLWCTIWE